MGDRFGRMLEADVDPLAQTRLDGGGGDAELEMEQCFQRPRAVGGGRIERHRTTAGGAQRQMGQFREGGGHFVQDRRLERPIRLSDQTDVDPDGLPPDRIDLALRHDHANDRIVVADILDQCVRVGEVHHAIAAGLMTARDVHGELGDVIAGRVPGRSSAEEIIVFDATGTALQDVAAAVAAYRKAVRQGRGSVVSLQE